MLEKVDEIEVAMKLLRNEGLNRASFARIILHKDKIIPKDKDDTRKLFDDSLALIKEEHGDDIYKDGHDHFLKEDSIESLRKVIAELELKNADLRKRLTELSGNPKIVIERKQWLYKKGKGEMFNISEVPGKIEEGWKDHPNG